MSRRFQYVRLLSYFRNHPPAGEKKRVIKAFLSDGSSTSFEGLDAGLAQLGNEGWELVTATETETDSNIVTQLYLKRATD